MGKAQGLLRRFNVPPTGRQQKPSALLNEYQSALEDLLEADPADFAHRDIAFLNLLCAPNLAGSEKLDIQRCLARLDQLAAYVKSCTERSLRRFPSDPDYGHCEPMWRMGMLVTCVKLDFGVRYDPIVAEDLRRDGHSPFTDSRNVFIHGMLTVDPSRRWGSCSSIPVLVVAVARRLGYPVALAVNRRHVYARWDDGRGFAFNIEASNPAGMVVHSDDYYRNVMYGPMTDAEFRSGFYGRSLSEAEVFGLFLRDRVWCLHDTARYEQTLLWSARALQYSPDDPHFAEGAMMTAELALKHRYRQKYPDRLIPPPERNHEFSCNPFELTSVAERSLFLTIAAHVEERTGNLSKAREHYEDACRQNPFGNNEQRDLQRFLRKHDLPQWQGGPLLPPKGCEHLRRLKLPNAAPHRESVILDGLADQFQRDGKMMLARDALFDRYLFDPSDVAIYQRLRTVEKHPRFQEELIEDARRRGQTIRPAPAFCI